jgi:magnesium chelatase family protein
MFSRVITCGLLGLEGYDVLVETDLSNGLPNFDIVGLAGAAVKEARERVRAAIQNSGFTFPSKRIVVNMSPADTRKEGSGYDLAVAIGILLAMGCLEPRQDPDALLARTAFCGELSLDGTLRPVNGMLSKALAARAAGCEAMILPEQNAREAVWVKGLSVLPARTLSDVCRHVTGIGALAPCRQPGRLEEVLSGTDHGENQPDFSDVHGQCAAKRAMEVAAAGGHHLFLVGGPGAGKSMLASRLPGILPQPDLSEALEITRIHSVAGLPGDACGLVTRRPFRAPHHTISTVGLIGGGRIPKPGEISLAHGGVLFLDELPEFSQFSLDALRQPMENGEVTLTRIHATLRYPSRFMLVAASNPCKCGHFGDPTKTCTCPPHDAERYFARISGPMLDRFDIRHKVPSLTWQEMTGQPSGESSASIRARVAAARLVQQQRYARGGIHCNAQLSGKMLRACCALDAESQSLPERAHERFGLSMRGHDRVLRVARTIADLEGSREIRQPHVAEAIQYRNTER